MSDVEYKPFGPVASVTYGNDVKQVWDYDDAYRIDAWHIEKSDTSVLESWNYTLDASGNVTDRTVNSASTPYAYDAMDRLTQDGFLNYTYDGNGNLNHQYLYLAYQTNSNRIATYWGSPVNYDGMGNQLNKGTGVQFTYDPAGRLKTLNEGTQTLLNLYNGLGQRNYTRRTLTATESYVEFFTYAPDGRFLTYISSAQTYGTNGQPNGLGVREAVHYLWLDQTPVAQIRERYYANGTHWDTQLVYLHTDHLNTPRRATNSTESIVWKANSYAYGLTTEVPDPDGNSEATWIALRFPGQMAYNAGYQFNYNYYRDYDAVTGRYLESDPIGLGGGVNTYGYVGGNPLLYVDATGLCKCKAVNAERNKDSVQSPITIGGFKLLGLNIRTVNCEYECVGDWENKDVVRGTHREWYWTTWDDSRESNCLGASFFDHPVYDYDYTRNRTIYSRKGFESFDPRESDQRGFSSADLQRWANANCCNN